MKKIIFICGPLFLYALFPLTFSFTKPGLSLFSPTFFVAIRMIVSGLLLFCIAYFQEKIIFKDVIRYKKLFLQASLLGIYFTYLPSYWALQYISVAKSAFIYMLAPFFTALIAYFKGLETFSFKKIIGFALGIVGFIPVIMFSPSESVGSLYIFYGLPEVMMILSVASYAYSWIAVKELIYQKHIPPIFLNSVSMFFSGLLALLTSYVIDNWDLFFLTHTQITYHFLYNVSMTSLIGMICYLLYTLLLKYFPATFLSFFGLIEPFFAAFYGWFFLSETIPHYFFISLTIVGCGLYLYYQEELRISSLTITKKE